jgi:hypothetical protein
MSTPENYPSDVSRTVYPADIELSLHVSNVDIAIVVIGRKSRLKRLS